MERDERALLIVSWKLGAGVKHHVDGRPMCRECYDGRRECGAAPHLLSIAAVFRVQDKLLQSVIEEAIRPSEIGSLHGSEHGLGRTFRVLFGCKHSGPKLI